MATASQPTFDPTAHQDGVLEAFREFVSAFHYTYDDLNWEIPSSCQDENARRAWRNIDKKRVFLGKFSHRNLQKQLEDCSTSDGREAMNFADMVKKFEEKFQLSSNVTLANFKFRKLNQEQGESLDLFIIRVKKEAQSCDFSCESANCSVRDVLIRDQILIGTINDEIRRQVLKEQWKLADLEKNGRALEAATKGAAEIKIKEEPQSEVNRIPKPGKYSKKKSVKESSWKKCQNCSSSKCEGGKKCPGNKATCFSCNQKGHFRGSSACKKRRKNKTRKVSDDSETEISSSAESGDESDPHLPEVNHSKKNLRENPYD